MKKGIVLILILFAFSIAYTQEGLIKTVQKITLENDSLQRVVSTHKNEITQLKGKIEELESKNNNLANKNKDLESRLEKLDKQKIKADRDKLKTNLDSLSQLVGELRDSIEKKDKAIETEKKRGEDKSIQEKEKGKQEVLDKIIETYSKPLDSLIKNSTLEIIERDIVIVGNNPVVQKKFKDLRKYFNAELVLSEKFNEEKIENAKNQLNSIEQTELVQKLKKRLDDYTQHNDAMNKTIDKILDIDKKFVANDEDMQKEKFEYILNELAWYFRNYDFNVTDYPHLTDIVLDIIKRKQRNADADISDLKNKLHLE